MLRMKSDLVELCLRPVNKPTRNQSGMNACSWRGDGCGYPGDYRTGDVIHGLPLEEAATAVFHVHQTGG